MTSRWYRSLAVATIGASALLAACGGEAPASGEARPVLTVDLVAPVAEDWPDVLTASGEVAPWWS